MLRANGLSVIDPPAPERSFLPWSVSTTSWNLLLKTTLWESRLACSKQCWPYLLPGRKTKRKSKGFVMKGIWRILMTSYIQHQSLTPVANRSSQWAERLKVCSNSCVTSLLVSEVVSGEPRKPVDTANSPHWAWPRVGLEPFWELNYPTCVLLDLTF